MKLRPFASSFLFLIALTCGFASLALICSADTHDAVLLESIPTLTFYNGQYTAGRRTAPIPQVRCVGGTAQGASYQPKVVQCRNMGSDGRDIQWRCEADMDSSYRFGAIRVSCEGYNHPDDPYVLRGSCGFEYELDYTEEGRQKQNQGNYGGGTFTGAGYYQNNYNYDDGYSTTGTIFSFLILGFIVYVLYSICSGGSRPAYGGGGGGGYGGGPDFGPGFGGGGPYGGGCGPTYVQPPVYQPGGGGFWSGMATGGLLGYLWNRPRAGYSYGYGAPSMFGGGGYSRPYAGTTTFGGGGGGVSASSGGSRTAAGFGGTTRR